MASESRRVPSLVTYCQRILSTHADAITCLGDDVRYDVIKPVLECCSADTLLHLEQSSPYLEQDTSDLWERLCFKSYPLLAQQLADEQPESWREQYFLLREAEAHRLEEVALRLRNQRMEAAERKKEREVKLTDRLPPPKRTRIWGTSAQPKTLFQKTRHEATKLQRALYAPRSTPQIPSSKALHPTTSSLPTAPPPKSITSRVTGRTVTTGCPSASTLHTSSRRSGHSTKSADPVLQQDSRLSHPQLSSPAHSPHASESRPSKPPIQKKDPMASLFMPKHRALSQLPSQTSSDNRTVPAR